MDLLRVRKVINLKQQPILLLSCCLLLHLIVCSSCVTARVNRTQTYTFEKMSETVAKGRICIGTNGRLSVPSNRENHYRNLRERYMNCTYIDGNLELTWLQDEAFDLSFLHDIREVTGYILISHVNLKKVVLPNLQIIRGRTLFKMSQKDDEYALIVTLCKMFNLEMPALRDILAGNVGLFNNYNLCHVRTIRWDEIITEPGAKHVYVYNFTEEERKCPPCDNSCLHGCWGDGPHNCQQFSKINCSPQCHQGRCFGMQPRECCHLFCAGGCTGPKQSDCLACRNFYDNGVCKQECPPMSRYNPITYSWESNPDGKYAYGATCVKECPEHLLKDNGACVRMCPPKKKPVNGECVLCDGPCPKTCEVKDSKEWIHSGNIDSFKDCTIIEGHITILEATFNGYQHIYPNFTFGPRFGPMHPDKLEVFSTLREITGHINIQATHPDFKNLSYFRNLEAIGGRQLTEYFAALYIVKTSLESLNLHSLKRIRAGSVFILENPKLCYVEGINWKSLNFIENNIQRNKPKNECIALDHVCNAECSSDGCWGQGADACLSCANYQLHNMCVAGCNSQLGIYDAGNKKCKHCDPECKHTCSGPGSGNCTECLHVSDGPYCVTDCPITKYNDKGVCHPCHPNCMDGCTGPNNTVGPGGCNSCDRAVARGFGEPFTFEHCIAKDEPCPNGYFLDYVGPQEQDSLKALIGKSYCRQCHPRCLNCTNYGFHTSVCSNCARYKHNEHCEDHCPSDFFPDDKKECKPCSGECRECFGPGNDQCRRCRNFKIVENDNSTMFNCTAVCPFDKPYKYQVNITLDPICTDELPDNGEAMAPGTAVTGPAQQNYTENMQSSAVVGGTIACVILLAIFLGGFGYHFWRRAKLKENTVKMTMQMSGYEGDEPLKPTNVKPNLAQLRIVKEAELRRGGILGYGAFGTVYKGVWVPEGENVKIPVAIKVLREGTGTNTNKEILEEAYIMASVEHPNLLQLLAVCMTSQMMLVTQLMPLGCILDYIRNNKDKIGSKALLNWCTQIAKGMAYLEERRLVHRDLAARNVLVQTPKCVKITDFGLAKLLDINEDEYKAAGGKMPIKWLALECIQHRIFTHKSDVWAFGVTVWELLSYGGRPYEEIPARDVPDLLEKGERLPQPPICTIDVYMIMIKCWVLDAESRPSFKELTDEFAKMARDPGRYLVIRGDKLMRLPSYTQQDEKELIRNLSITTEGTEVFMDAEEYLQPKMRMQNSSDSTEPPPSTFDKTGSDNHWVSDGSVRDQNQISRSPQIRSSKPDRKYSHLEAAVANSPNLRGGDMNNSRYSSDPLKLLNKDTDPESDSVVNGVTDYGPNTLARLGELRLNLPVDEDDYLMPSPQPNQNASTYMDLIGDSKLSDLHGGNHVDYSRYIPDFVPVANRGVAMDNPEYHIMNGVNPQQTVGVPEPRRTRRKNTSSEEDSDHEYYNDYERLQRELQPLNHRRNETTV